MSHGGPRAPLVALSWALLVSACGGGVDPVAGDDASVPAVACSIEVSVRLDGAPAAGITVGQGGRPERWVTGGDGTVTVDLDRGLEGDLVVIASHPEARTRGEVIYEGMCAVTVDLVRFVDEDNEGYVFKDPGTPEHSPSTNQCGHCHERVNAAWYDTPHRAAASNPTVQDLYRGEASAIGAQPGCEAAGGQWLEGPVPGQEISVPRCYLGAGVLGALNADCGDPTCLEGATAHGGCADCHAPGIDGSLGGRDLREARGHAYDFGVHCEVCHHVESVHEGAAPGVAGWLRILRPTEPSTSSFLGDWVPLLFGPDDDVPMVLMGMVPRAHFREARFCAGCHHLDQEVLVPGHDLDSTRWPSGRLPIHSTWTEWQESSYGGVLPCQGCHMPADAEALNSAGLEKAPSTAGVAAGWARPAGAVKQHSWPGPRAASGALLESAANLTGSAALNGDGLQVELEVTNTGAGHALPTGEPMRQVVLTVAASCAGESLPALDGPAIPAHGGYVARKEAEEDWSLWPDAVPGDVLRIVRLTGEYRDYQGPGPFGDGTFDPEQKGLLIQSTAGTVTVDSVDSGIVSLSGPLPDGQVAYLQRPSAPQMGLAGAPGALFARVVSGPDGTPMAPHFLAVDVVSDNRLMPGASWSTAHSFAATCAAPAVMVTLLHRAYPHRLAIERGWEQRDRVMATLNLTVEEEP